MRLNKCERFSIGFGVVLCVLVALGVLYNPPRAKSAELTELPRGWFPINTFACDTEAQMTAILDLNASDGYAAGMEAARRIGQQMNGQGEHACGVISEPVKAEAEIKVYKDLENGAGSKSTLHLIKFRRQDGSEAYGISTYPMFKDGA